MRPPRSHSKPRMTAAAVVVINLLGIDTAIVSLDRKGE